MWKRRLWKGGFGRRREQRNNKYYIQCFDYNKYGDYAYECWSNPHKDVKEKINYVEEQDNANIVCLA